MAKDKSNGNANGHARKRGGGRKSKAESMTGAKAASVEVRNGELDIPEPVVIASSDFQFYLKAAKSAVEKKDTAVSLLNGVYKQAGKIHKNLPGALRKIIALERKDDDQDLRGELEVLGIALREIGSPIQITIHDTLLGDVKAQAYARGKKDCDSDKFAANPYPGGSDLATEYSRGWEEAMAARAPTETQPAALPSNGAEELRNTAH